MWSREPQDPLSYAPALIIGITTIINYVFMFCRYVIVQELFKQIHQQVVLLKVFAALATAHILQ